MTFIYVHNVIYAISPFTVRNSFSLRQQGVILKSYVPEIIFVEGSHHQNFEESLWNERYDWVEFRWSIPIGQQLNATIAKTSYQVNDTIDKTSTWSNYRFWLDVWLYEYLATLILFLTIVTFF
jgi:hypothetical protein